MFGVGDLIRIRHIMEYFMATIHFPYPSPIPRPWPYEVPKSCIATKKMIAKAQITTTAQTVHATQP